LNSRFRLKLSVVLILFAIVISLTIATADYIKLRQQMVRNHQLQLQQIEETVVHTLRTLEKSYFLFGKDITSKMKAGSLYLSELYRKQPSFDEWDFQALKEHLGFDVYIINEHNVITHSSFKEDIGMDFNKCCKKLAAALDEIRASGEFFDDGMDIEQHTGAVKKYSYMATHDRKYLIQLGYSLQDGDIFQELDFLKTIDELIRKYPSIYDIHVLNIGGLALGKPVETGKLTKERRLAFERTLATGQTTELKSFWENQPAIFRYVHYVSEYDEGTTKNKVLEIIYNGQELRSLLEENKKTFIFRLFIVLSITVVMSLMISRWLAKPMYLAFHDSLTGLKNRAAFDELLDAILKKNKGTTAVLMIDIDDFKLVNDRLGHDKGDQLLKDVAKSILAIARNRDIPIRWGGDEFALIMPATNEQEAEQTAEKLIEEITKSIDHFEQFLVQEKGKVTVSIGISLAPHHGTDRATLCKKADIALYEAKEKGKNRYQLYSGTAEDTDGEET